MVSNGFWTNFVSLSQCSSLVGLTACPQFSGYITFFCLEKQNVNKQDSKELSPRSLDKMLLKRQVNVQSTQLSNFFKFSKSSKFSKILWIYDFQTCLKLFRFNMIWIVTIHKILKHVWTCSNMSKLVQIKYDTNCYNS